MLIAGLWHGASWTFLIWGAMQGTMLCIEKIFSEIKERKAIGEEILDEEKNAKKSFDFLRIIPVFIFVNISWLVFFSSSLSELSLYLRSLGNISQPFQIISPFILLIFFAGLFLQLPSESLRKKAFTIYSRLPMIVKVVTTVSFLCGFNFGYTAVYLFCVLGES